MSVTIRPIIQAIAQTLTVTSIPQILALRNHQLSPASLPPIGDTGQHPGQAERAEVANSATTSRIIQNGPGRLPLADRPTSPQQRFPHVPVDVDEARRHYLAASDNHLRT